MTRQLLAFILLLCFLNTSIATAHSSAFPIYFFSTPSPPITPNTLSPLPPSHLKIESTLQYLKIHLEPFIPQSLFSSRLLNTSTQRALAFSFQGLDEGIWVHAMAPDAASCHQWVDYYYTQTQTPEWSGWAHAFINPTISSLSFSPEIKTDLQQAHLHCTFDPEWSFYLMSTRFSF